MKEAGSDTGRAPCIEVHMDESGNWNSSDRSSKYFTLGFTCRDTRIHMDGSSKVKHALRNTNKTKKPNKKSNEFKFSDDDVKTRNRFIDAMLELDEDFGVMCIEKTQPKSIYGGIAPLYLEVLAKVIPMIEERYCKNNTNGTIQITLDRSFNRKVIEKFERDYSEDVYKTRPDPCRCAVSIRQEYSEASPMIQAADYVAGSVQSAFENADLRAYDRLKAKIRISRTPAG
ncbi:MAG: DUF3800 domain-containing protein [Gammaproteobacteria bacterium]|nr:DUF3800 domain-containing protein [Gammaproteobacteria bacterium]